MIVIKNKQILCAYDCYIYTQCNYITIDEYYIDFKNRHNDDFKAYENLDKYQLYNIQHIDENGYENLELIIVDKIYNRGFCIYTKKFLENKNLFLSHFPPLDDELDLKNDTTYICRGEFKDIYYSNTNNIISYENINTSKTYAHKDIISFTKQTKFMYNYGVDISVIKKFNHHTQTNKTAKHLFICDTFVVYFQDIHMIYNMGREEIMQLTNYYKEEHFEDIQYVIAMKFKEYNMDTKDNIYVPDDYFEYFKCKFSNQSFSKYSTGDDIEKHIAYRYFDRALTHIKKFHSYLTPTETVCWLKVLYNSYSYNLNVIETDGKEILYVCHGENYKNLNLIAGVKIINIIEAYGDEKTSSLFKSIMYLKKYFGVISPNECIEYFYDEENRGNAIEYNIRGHPTKTNTLLIMQYLQTDKPQIKYISKIISEKKNAFIVVIAQNNELKKYLKSEMAKSSKIDNTNICVVLHMAIANANMEHAHCYDNIKIIKPDKLECCYSEIKIEDVFLLKYIFSTDCVLEKKTLMFVKDNKDLRKITFNSNLIF